MTQLRSKFDFEDTDEPTKGGLKTLPNSFDDSKDEVSFAKSLIISLILHPLCVFLIWLTILALTLLGLSDVDGARREFEHCLEDDQTFELASFMLKAMDKYRN